MATDTVLEHMHPALTLLAVLGIAVGDGALNKAECQPGNEGYVRCRVGWVQGSGQRRYPLAAQMVVCAG